MDYRPTIAITMGDPVLPPLPVLRGRNEVGVLRGRLWMAEPAWNFVGGNPHPDPPPGYREREKEGGANRVAVGREFAPMNRG